MYGELTNETLESVFYIFAISTSENDCIIILMAVLLIYLTILSGNFFLCNLSTLDILYSSTTLPKLIYISHTGDHFMSRTACIAQLFFYLFFANTECFLLTAMAIDRYVAVCFPLHYSIIINKQVCMLLASLAFFAGLTNASIGSCLTSNLTFSGLVELRNFFCDLKALYMAAVSDTTPVKSLIIADAVFIGGLPSCIILASYICIISTVLKIKSSDGRWKTFSSCSSHITIVVLYIGSAMTLYLTNSPEQDIIFSMKILFPRRKTAADKYWKT